MFLEEIWKAEILIFTETLKNGVCYHLIFNYANAQTCEVFSELLDPK